MQFNIVNILLICSIFGCLEFSQAVSEAEAMAMMKKIEDACIKTNSALTADEIKRIETHKIFGKDAPKASNNVQCYLHCLYSQIKLVDSDGKHNAENMLEYIGHMIKDQAKAKAALQKCATIKGANACESVYNFENCIYEQLVQ